MRATARRAALGAVAALAAEALLAGAARADGFSALAEPTVSAARTNTVTEDSRAIPLDSLQIQQRYRLSLDRQFFPQLSFHGQTNYEQDDSRQVQETLPTVTGQSRFWGLTLRLDLGSGAVTGGVSFDVRGRTDESRTGSAPTVSTPERYNDSLLAFVSWRPVDLPTAELRQVFTRAWDDAPGGVDTSTRITTLQSVWAPTVSSELRYRGAYQSEENREGGTLDETLLNGLRGSWSETFLDRRAQLFLSADVGQSHRETTASRAGASRETQQTIAAGLSGVERFPTTPDRITLDPNPGLVDGNTTASAGIDLGYALSEAGDIDPRDMGARFPNVATPVNELRLWVDQRLPAGVSGAFTFTVYRSDDNITWTPVALSGGPRFSTLENRFEIPVERTSARYLKVVTRPLAAGVTTDLAYAKILVTELQAWLVEPLPVGKTVDNISRGAASGSARYVFIRSWNFTWDGFGDVSRTSDQDFTQWIVTNGLSFTRRVVDAMVLSGRVERSDDDAGSGHETSHRANLSSAFDPLPTLGGTASVNALRYDGPSGGRTESGSQLGFRIDLYSGVSATTQGDFTYSWTDEGVHTRRFSGTGNLSLTPHKTLTLAGSYSYSDSLRTSSGLADVRDRRARVDGSASWAPMPALAISASVGREFYIHTGNLYSVNAIASPFREGSMQLSFTYAESLDTIADSRTRTFGPTVRWRFARRGQLEMAYTNNRTRTAITTTDSQVLYARLLINLG